jgi:hypothetical protein
MIISCPSWKSIGVTALAALVLGGCAAEDESPLAPEQPPASSLFDRYVAIGTSLTAGFQSAGINDSTQAQAYPVLIAQQANAPFYTPTIPAPGCPAPYTGPVILPGAQRLGGVGVDVCTLRETPAPPYVSNLAVVGAFLPGFSDNSIRNNPPTADVYETLILGARTQEQALIAARPSLVSVELGSNDVLFAVYTGDPSLLPSVDDFRTGYARVVDAVDQTPAQDAVLIGISPLQTAVVQPGAFLWALTQGPAALLPPAAVSANCAPFTLTGQRNPLSGNLIYLPGALTAAAAGAQISCADDADFLLNANEYQTFLQRVGAFNAVIEQAAEDNGWIYVDPNTVLPLGDPAKFRNCQLLNVPLSTTPNPDVTPATFAAAVATTCPGPGAPNFFGTMVSYDLTHPTAEYHQAMADAIIAAINQKHQLSIPLL